jgi:dTDP-4-dehydrorhamnose reductase
MMARPTETCRTDMCDRAGGNALHTLIVGHGLIGAAISTRLQAAGHNTVCVGHRQRDLPGYLALDLASEPGRADLEAALARLRPRSVVLVHGPSDVTWIDQNETAAAAVHCGVAAIVARSGVPAVLVSTDNVFPGRRGGYRPEDPVEPANGYGRVKARAEDILLAGGSALALRVSLVYGWAGPGLRATFAQRCLDSAAEGRPMSAPTDQGFTPIHVADVADVTAAVGRAQAVADVTAVVGRPGAHVTGVAHLAGPDELSRYEFARIAYDLAGADPGLVSPCLRQDTVWACRPRFSSLACGDFTGLPGLAAWRPMTPAEGLTAMLASRPEPTRQATGQTTAQAMAQTAGEAAGQGVRSR